MSAKHLFYLRVLITIVLFVNLVCLSVYLTSFSDQFDTTQLLTYLAHFWFIAAYIVTGPLGLITYLTYLLPSFLTTFQRTSQIDPGKIKSHQQNQTWITFLRVFWVLLLAFFAIYGGSRMLQEQSYLLLWCGPKDVCPARNLAIYMSFVQGVLMMIEIGLNVRLERSFSSSSSQLSNSRLSVDNHVPLPAAALGQPVYHSQHIAPHCAYAPQPQQPMMQQFQAGYYLQQQPGYIYPNGPQQPVMTQLHPQVAFGSTQSHLYEHHRLQHQMQQQQQEQHVYLQHQQYQQQAQPRAQPQPQPQPQIPGTMVTSSPQPGGQPIVPYPSPGASVAVSPVLPPGGYGTPPESLSPVASYAQ